MRAVRRCAGARYPTVNVGKSTTLEGGCMGSCPAGSVCSPESQRRDMAMGRNPTRGATNPAAEHSSCPLIVEVRRPLSRLNRGKRTSRETGHAADSGVAGESSGVNSRSRPKNPRNQQPPGVTEPFPGVNSRDRSTNPGVAGRYPGVNSSGHAADPPGPRGAIRSTPPLAGNRLSRDVRLPWLSRERGGRTYRISTV